MSHLEKTELKIGFIPLLDCIALLWADHRGFFEEQGLNVELVREASWASLRDRLSYGFLDVAHCLSAMLPASTLGQDALGIQLQTPLVLSQNRAFITLSQKKCFDLNISVHDSELISSKKITQAIASNDPFKFAYVFKYSIHHYCLREWLALSNTKIAKEIQLSTLPPPFMAEALANQQIDGFCVGEPWNIQAEIMGTGHKIVSSQDIIPAVADKVLAVTEDWAAENPNTLKALCTAIKKAQDELRILENFEEVWALLNNYEIVQFNCSQDIHVEKYHLIQTIIRHFVDDHMQPVQSDFIWLIEQMIKWDNLEMNPTKIDEISRCCVLN